MSLSSLAKVLPINTQQIVISQLNEGFLAWLRLSVSSSPPNPEMQLTGSRKCRPDRCSNDGFDPTTGVTSATWRRQSAIITGLTTIFIRVVGVGGIQRVPRKRASYRPDKGTYLADRFSCFKGTARLACQRRYFSEDVSWQPIWCI